MSISMMNAAKMKTFNEFFFKLQEMGYKQSRRELFWIIVKCPPKLKGRSDEIKRLINEIKSDEINKGIPILSDDFSKKIKELSTNPSFIMALAA